LALINNDIFNNNKLLLFITVEMTADTKIKTDKMKKNPSQEMFKLKIHSWGAVYLQVTLLATRI